MRFWTIFGCFSLQTCSTSFSQSMVVDLLFFSIRFFICFLRDLPKVCHNISEMDSWSEFVWNLCSNEIKPRITFFRSKARKNHTNHLKKKKLERKSVCTFFLLFKTCTVSWKSWDTAQHKHTHVYTCILSTPHATD